MSRRVYFTVSLPLPKGATVAEVKDYIHDAVASWGGALRPPGGYDPEDEGDPLFGIKHDTVEVEARKKPRAK